MRWRVGMVPVRRGAGTAPASPLRRRRTSLDERQLDEELAPSTLAGARGRDRATVELDEAAHQVEPDPEAGVRSALAVAALHEDVEDPAQHVRWDPDAVVAHAHREHLAVAIGGQLERDVPTLVR